MKNNCYIVIMKLMIILLFVTTQGMAQVRINTNTFYNDVLSTSYKLADIIELEDVSISIYYMPTKVIINGQEVGAHLMKGFDDDYYIYLSPYLRDNDIQGLLAHEFAHIQQYETGELRIISREANLFMFRGKYFKGRNKSRFGAPHENSAYIRAKQLMKGLNNFVQYPRYQRRSL